MAYYPRIIEPLAEPSTMEAFLPTFQPELSSPFEGHDHVQQLGFTPSCSVVLVRGSVVPLKRKIVFGRETVRTVRQMASQLAPAQSCLPQQQFKNAMQWHMNNFVVTRRTFE